MMFIFFTVVSISGLRAFETTLNNAKADEIFLTKKLENTLPKYFPPYDMLNKTVFVYTDLMQIFNVDEKHGIWVVKIWLSLSYQSKAAMWNDSGNGSSLPSSVIVPSGTFWTPDLGT